MLNRINFNEINEIVYDASEIGRIEPFGMLLISSKIREISKIYKDKTGKLAKYKKIANPNSYASHMGLYRSLLMKYGNKPGEANGSCRYSPITGITVDKIIEDSNKLMQPVGETVTNYAHELSNTLYTGDTKCIDHMTFAIREIMRNVVEHSNSKTLWYCAQAWPSENSVEIAILDEGIGIQETIASNSYYRDKNQDNLTAIQFSLQPGITKTFSPHRSHNDDDTWKNSGFGLYMTSNICRTIGDFVICSKGHALVLRGDNEYIFKTSFNGTAIRMRLNLSKLSEVTKLRSQLIRQGEKEARANGKEAVKSASKASRLSYIK